MFCSVAMVVWKVDVSCSVFNVYAKHNVIIVLRNGIIYKLDCIFKCILGVNFFNIFKNSRILFSLCK